MVPEAEQDNTGAIQAEDGVLQKAEIERLPAYCSTADAALRSAAAGTLFRSRRYGDTIVVVVVEGPVGALSLAIGETDAFFLVLRVSGHGRDGAEHGAGHSAKENHQGLGEGKQKWDTFISLISGK